LLALPGIPAGAGLSPRCSNLWLLLPYALHLVYFAPWRGLLRTLSPHFLLVVASLSATHAIRLPVGKDDRALYILFRFSRTTASLQLLLDCTPPHCTTTYPSFEDWVFSHTLFFCTVVLHCPSLPSSCHSLVVCTTSYVTLFSCYYHTHFTFWHVVFG